MIRLEDLRDEKLEIFINNGISILCGLDNGTMIDLYSNSKKVEKDNIFFMVRFLGKDFLTITSEQPEPWSFAGESGLVDSLYFKICPEISYNMALLQRIFPFTKPSVLGKDKSTFGVGDRLGIASPGHLRVFERYDVVPVLAQQSMRELDLTGRTYKDIVQAAAWAVFKTGYKKPWAADGDHLKHAEDISSALEQGCTMITADLSDHINFDTSKMDRTEQAELYSQFGEEYRSIIEQKYAGNKELSNGLILRYNKNDLIEIVITYKQAVEYAQKLYLAAFDSCEDLDFEISIDETDLPTTIEAHYFVATELIDMGVKFSSLAPRFIGEFQKGIDYIGDISEFKECFIQHSKIADILNYKISVHSSSDKFTVYPIIGKSSLGPFHLKTSGTNWLVALEVISIIDPDFFRDLFNYAYNVFPEASSYYHVTPDMGIATELFLLKDHQLYTVFNNPTDRQVLHVSYGEIFKNLELKDQLFEILNSNIEHYWKKLDEHIGRHLELLMR